MASFHLEPSVVMVGIRILPPDPHDQTTGQGQALVFCPRATIGQHKQVSIGTVSENNNKAGKGRRSGSVSGSVADPDPGSGAFSTPGSWIPNPYF